MKNRGHDCGELSAGIGRAIGFLLPLPEPPHPRVFLTLLSGFPASGSLVALATFPMVSGCHHLPGHHVDPGAPWAASAPRPLCATPPGMSAAVRVPDRVPSHRRCRGPRQFRTPLFYAIQSSRPGIGNQPPKVGPTLRTDPERAATAIRRGDFQSLRCGRVVPCGGAAPHLWLFRPRYRGRQGTESGAARQKPGSGACGTGRSL
jgi:hypothetical protein